jgi:hypothetical protein
VAFAVGSVTRETVTALCTADGPVGRSARRNGRWRGSFQTKEAEAERRRLRELIRQMRATMGELP